MWVRTRGLRTNVDECHFTEKALPSTGFLPFLQSYICTFNNTCHRSYNDSLVKTGDLTLESFLKLVNDLEEVFKTNSTNKVENSSFRSRKWFSSSTSSLEEFSSIIKAVSQQSRVVNDNVVIKDNLNDTESLYKEIIQRNVKIDPEIIKRLMELELNLGNIKPSHLGLFGDNPKTIFCDEVVMKDLVNADDYRFLKNFLCSLNDKEASIVQNLFFKHWTISSGKEQMEYFVNRGLGKNISWTEWLSLKRTFKDFENSLSTLDNFSTTFDKPSSNQKLYKMMMANEKKNQSKIEKALKLINTFFCGNGSEEAFDKMFSIGMNATRFDSLQDQLRDRTKIKYQYDNESSAACNKVYRKIEENPALSLIWRIMKPYLVGKVVYTPVTNATKNVMERVNASFLVFTVMKAFGSLDPSDTSDSRELLTYLPIDDILQINEFLNSTKGKQLMYELLNEDKESMTKIEKNQKILSNLYFKATAQSKEKNKKMIDDLILFQLFECIESNKIEAIDDLHEAQLRGMKLIEFNKLWALIEFISPGDEQLNSLITYKIRMNTERVDNTEYIQDLLLRPGARMRPAIDLKYITFGFAYLQDIIDHAIISEQTGREDVPGIIFQQFPYPCYIDDEFIMAISRTFPLFMVLSWVYTCSMIVKAIVYEKEQRLKETMRVMGLGNGIHWVGWFIDSLIPMSFTIFLLTIILVYGDILRNSNPVIVYLFLFCYSLATISQSFLISVFFSRANLAAASAGIIFFVLYLPYPFLVRWMFYLTSVHKGIMALSSNVAFGIGASYLALYEEKGTGIQWKYIATSPYYADNFSLASVIYMLLVDCVIYLILTWYIEAVFPGQYGIPKPWYFPLTRSYWSGKDTTKVFVSPADDILNENYSEGEQFETEPRELKKGVIIKNLTKQYSNGKVAVNGISLNFYEGQITSFLGHNGAGKTTTISILTGLFPPTSGTAFINGYDIRKDMDRIRKSLGMCPQHNVLFNRLTVEEHLWFYGSLRAGNTSDEAIRMEVDQMIYDLGLPHKRHARSTALSGGMQRKLSIAVAFIGGSKVVILDEPTSGVDPFSRRSIWELLLKYKTDRTVILTTHYMDEADLLGDRIAIIANGKVQCCGSSIFLKNRYGSGYHLTIELPSHGKKMPPTTQFDQDGDISGIDETIVSGLTKYISSIVSSVIFVEHIGSEVSYILPERDNTPALVKLCDSLDKDKETLGIVSYGISDTSLEEIFLRVAENDPANLFEANNNESRSCWDRCFRRKKVVEKGKLKEDSSENTSRHSSVPIIDDLENSKRGPENKYWRQFFALHTKKFHHTKRNRKALFSELILPAIFVCMSLAVSSIFPKLQERPPLPLDPWVYPPPRHMFYSKDTPDVWMSRYIDNMKGPDGLGVKCIIINGTRDKHCSSSSPVPSERSRFQLSKSYSNLRCSCESGAQICPDGIGEPPPPSVTLAAGDIMYDLTNSNISDWLVNTWPKYEEHRYGGFSFGSLLAVPSLGIRDFIYRLYAMQQPGFMEYIEALYPNRTNSTINNIKVWYNNKGWLSSVGYMNAINNVLLRASIPPEKASERSTYGILTINHPMNFTSKQLSIELIRQGGVTLLHAISVIFALSFVPASFTLYIIEERVSHSKHLQLVSGVNKVIYWLQTFTWDLSAYLVSAFLCVFIFLAFDEEAYVSSDHLPGLLLLFLLYGWSCIPLMYPISFLFSIPSSAFVGLACANMFIGVITTITTFVLGAFDDKELSAINDILKEVFLIFPHFCLGDGLIKLATNHLATASLMNLDIEFESNVFEWHFLGKNLLCMFAFGLLFFLTTLAIEFELFNYVKVNTEVVNESKIEDEDDVAAEKRRIALGQTSTDILVINDLSKVYNWSNVPSVNHISIGVKPGECFGLLGLNGAGKTTTFKMLTGALKPTAGDAHVMNYSVVHDINKVRALLGYCPQFDALDPLLTPYEHLVLYARIRNVPSDILPKRVDACLQRMGLGYYSNKLAKTLSGGNRRKLSTAIALIGNPPLIYLDEPTSGMDPKARRFLWSCIQEIVKEGGCVILTSHSMEECQALCTRLTVMVSGTFKCLGSSQHLKMKYGSGYRIIIRCKDENILSVKDSVSIALPSVRLIEEHYNQLRYEVSGLRLSHVFEEMEKLKKSSLILDYSISQTTLEEVFLRFANEQPDDPYLKSWKTSCVKQCFSCCAGKE